VYAETMPSICYADSNLRGTGGDGTRATDNVPMTRLGTDLQGGTLPDHLRRCDEPGRGPVDPGDHRVVPARAALPPRPPTHLVPQRHGPEQVRSR
jgi:hypothetical protein